MLLTLTDISDESSQNQIVRQLRANILNGELSSGSPIPSIRKLASENHISVITVQRAYELLEMENLIHSRRGKGFFVSDIKDDKRVEIARERLKTSLIPPINNALQEGLTVRDVKKVIDTILRR